MNRALVPAAFLLLLLASIPSRIPALDERTPAGSPEIEDADSDRLEALGWEGPSTSWKRDDLEDYENGAHGDPETGVNRVPGYPIGDCIHCHDWHGGGQFPLGLFQAYETDVEKRELCFACHDGAAAPEPSAPPEEHGSGSTVVCVSCHDPHFPDAHGGGSGAGCEPCHGHDAGYEYEPGHFSEGRGTFLVHSTHTENDSDDLRGPFIGCDACHDTTNFPAFKSGQGEPPYDLSETDVCDNCHSAGGTYDGVGHPDHGAKFGNGGELGHNWVEGIYDDDGRIRPGAEYWCASCHDEAPAYSRPELIGGVYAPNMLGDSSTFGFFVNGHGRPSAAGTYARMNWQAAEDAGNPAADVLGCTPCHAGAPSESHIDHLLGTASRMPVGHENDQANSNCNQCHPPGTDATADPQFYVDSAAFEGGAHGGVLCTVCHDVHGVEGTAPAMARADQEALCNQCHAGHAGHALGVAFGKGGKTYTLECTSCHNIHAVTGVTSNGHPDDSPVSQPSDLTNVWGDAASEKMNAYAGSGTYRTPVGDSLSGSVLPDYASFCLDCHSAPIAEFGPHGEVNWGGDHHGHISSNVPNGGGSVPDWFGCGRGEGWDDDENLDDTWPVLPRGRGEQIWTRPVYDQEDRIGGANFVLSCTDCHVTHEAGIGSKLRSVVNGSPGDVIWNVMCNACHWYYSDWHAGMACGNASCHEYNSIHRMKHTSGDGSTRTFNHDLVADLRFENNLNDSGSWRMHGGWRVAAGSFATGRFGSAISVSDHPVEVGTRNDYWSTDEGHHGTWKYTEMKHHMTLEAWVYPTVDTGERKILAKHTYWDGGYALVLKQLDGALRAGLLVNVNGGGQKGVWDSADCNGLRGAFSSVPVRLNEWTHVAATYDSGLADRDPLDPTVGRIRIYLNGEDVTTSYSDESTCFAEPDGGEAAMYPYSDHNDDPVGVCYEDHWCASALSVGGLNWSAPSDNFVGRLDEVKIWNTTKDAAYFETADSQSPPRIGLAVGVISGDELTVTFSEGVWANPGMSGALQPSDFVLTDADNARTILAVEHVAGAAEATLRLSSPLDDSNDLLVDVLAAAPNAIFDEYDNVASTSGVVITPSLSCPEGVAAFQLNEPAGSAYILDDDHLLVGAVHDPAQTLLGDGYFHGDRVDNYIDFAIDKCLRASRKLTLEARFKPALVDDGTGNTIQRIFLKNGENYQTSIWRNNSFGNYHAPDGVASLAFWLRVKDAHGGQSWKPVLTDYDTYPIVADHWYEARIVLNSDKVGGIPVDIFVDDQGTDGAGAGEIWTGYANCTDSDQSYLPDDRKLQEGDEILGGDGTIHIGTSATHTLLFSGLIDWVRAELIATRGAPIALLSLHAQTGGGTSGVGGATIAWSADPGAGSVAGYRLERRIRSAAPASAGGSGSGPRAGGNGGWETVVALTTATSYFDPDASVGSEYRLFAINALGEEFLLGRTVLPPEGPLAAWPSPYSGGVMTISFASPGGSGGLGGAPAEVFIYDLAGRRMRTVARGDFPAGVNMVLWDGRDDAGRVVPAGVYFLKSVCAGRTAKVKFVVMR